MSAVIAGAFGWHWISNGWPPQRADWVTEIGLLITVEALAIAVVAASSAALSVSKYTESVKLELSGIDQQSIMLHEQAGVDPAQIKNGVQITLTNKGRQSVDISELQLRALVKAGSAVYTTGPMKFTPPTLVIAQMFDPPTPSAPRWYLNCDEKSPTTFELNSIVVLKPGEAVVLPDLWLEVVDLRGAIELFESGDRVEIHLDYAVRTSRGSQRLTHTTELVMQPPPAGPPAE